MTTKLDGPLKREISIGGVDYTLTIAPVGMTLTLKGRRKGFDLQWKDLVSGDAAMATALNASLTANLLPEAAGRSAAVASTTRSHAGGRASAAARGRAASSKSASPPRPPGRRAMLKAVK